MPRRTLHATGTVDINMTPMIDCVFLLIIFFILTAQFASADLAKLAVHEPHASMAGDERHQAQRPNHVIVNIVNQYGNEIRGRDPERSAEATAYIVNARRIDPRDADALESLLKARKADAEARGFEEFFVEIRGDRDIAYLYIEPVMLAASKAGIERMHLTAIAGR